MPTVQAPSVEPTIREQRQSPEFQAKKAELQQPTRDAFNEMGIQDLGYTKEALSRRVRMGLPLSEEQRRAWNWFLDKQDEETRQRERTEDNEWTDRHIATEHERADNAIQRKVRDAQKAGLSPLAVMGGGGMPSINMGRSQASARGHRGETREDVDDSMSMFQKLMLGIMAGGLLIPRGRRRR